MTTRFPVVPKLRVRAEVSLQDGTRINGQVFVEATSRIQDLLNGPGLFFPIVDETGSIRLINKNAVIEITPYD